MRAAPGPEGEKIREALREAIAYKSHEFNAHGVERNHRYASTAVIPDGTPMPPYQRVLLVPSGLYVAARQTPAPDSDEAA